MKLGKGTLLAILETACFVLGAIFFVMVIAIPSNPIWALVAGIICGLTGVIIWSCSLIIRTANKVGHKIHNQIEHTVVNKVDAEKVAQSILDDDDDKTYELHRADAYDDIIDDVLDQTEPTVEPAPLAEPAQKAAPQADKKVAKKAPKPVKPAKPAKQPTKVATPAPALVEETNPVQPTEQDSAAQERAAKRKQAAAQLKALMSGKSTPQSPTEK